MTCLLGLLLSLGLWATPARAELSVTIAYEPGEHLYHYYAHYLNWLEVFNWYAQLLAGRDVEVNGAHLSSTNPQAEVYVPREVLLALPLAISSVSQEVLIGGDPAARLYRQLGSWINDVQHLGVATVTLPHTPPITVRLAPRHEATP